MKGRYYLTDLSCIKAQFPRPSIYSLLFISVSSEVINMISMYILVFIINLEICWSFMVLPFDNFYRRPPPIPQIRGDVGDALILTPYLKSNRSSEARSLSNVESLLPDDESITSNSGYFTVDEEYGSNLFFWFFRKNGADWQKAPLVLWLQGGPGCSSMYGLFEENGPVTYTEDGLKKRNYSWTENYNMLYIDQPVGTGFSFTQSENGYINTQEKVADHLYEALTQFFLLYPELKGNAFFISGESYAGKYIPAISYKIYKLKEANLTDINLKGLFMISAMTTGLVDGLADFCYRIGIIDSRVKTPLKEVENLIQSNIASEKWKNAFNSWLELLGFIGLTSGVSTYDYTKASESVNKELETFLKDVGVQRKIHVANVTFQLCNDDVYDLFSEDIPKSVVPWVEEILNDYSVAFVGGQFDIIVAYPLVLNVMEKLDWSDALTYKIAPRLILGDENLDGYIKSAGNLKDILILNAGHMVPKDQPRATFDLLNKFVNNEL